MLQPMAVAPIRHTAGAATSVSVLPPRLLVVDIMSASRTAGAAAEGSSPKTDRQLLVSVQLSTDGQPRAAGAIFSEQRCGRYMHCCIVVTATEPHSRKNTFYPACRRVGGADASSQHHRPELCIMG